MPDDDEQEQFEVQEVESVECSEKQSNTASIIQTEEYGNSVQVNLQTSGIAVQVNTQSAMAKMVELTAKYDLVSGQLKEYTGRLEASFYRIGFLESQLEERQKEIEQLKQKVQVQNKCDGD